MTSEELLAEERRMREVMDGFLAKHMRFIENASNFNVLGDFMDKHSLELTAANLHFSYESLAAAGELELVPFATPIPAPEPEPTPVPSPEEPTPQSVMPVKARTIMYRNGQPIEGTVKRYGDR